MPAARDIHRAGTRTLSAAMLVIGVAMIVSTLVRGGGVFAIGLVMGVLFTAAGGGRLYLSLRGD